MSSTGQTDQVGGPSVPRLGKGEECCVALSQVSPLFLYLFFFSHPSPLSPLHARLLLHMASQYYQSLVCSRSTPAQSNWLHSTWGQNNNTKVVAAARWTAFLQISPVFWPSSMHEHSRKTVDKGDGSHRDAEEGRGGCLGSAGERRRKRK